MEFFGVYGVNARLPFTDSTTNPNKNLKIFNSKIKKARKQFKRRVSYFHGPLNGPKVPPLNNARLGFNLINPNVPRGLGKGRDLAHVTGIDPSAKLRRKRFYSRDQMYYYNPPYFTGHFFGTNILGSSNIVTTRFEEAIKSKSKIVDNIKKGEVKWEPSKEMAPPDIYHVRDRSEEKRYEKHVSFI